MKNFRVELKTNWGGGNTTVYRGKYTIDANGYIKGFLKAEKDKSYVIGLKDEHENIYLIQIWARTNGDLEWPKFPVKYIISSSSNECEWEHTDSVHDHEFNRWKMGYGNYDYLHFSGTASIDIKEMAAYPLTEKENRIISNITLVEWHRIKNILKLNSESYRIMREKLTQ